VYVECRCTIAAARGAERYAARWNGNSFEERLLFSAFPVRSICARRAGVKSFNEPPVGVIQTSSPMRTLKFPVEPKA
jgi:hypothetical protein